jgi:hypothetical protein
VGYPYSTQILTLCPITGRFRNIALSSLVKDKERNDKSRSSGFKKNVRARAIRSVQIHYEESSTGATEKSFSFKRCQDLQIEESSRMVHFNHMEEELISIYTSRSCGVSRRTVRK